LPQIVYGKAEQLAETAVGLLQGETVYAVYDGVGFVGITNITSWPSSPCRER